MEVLAISKNINEEAKILNSVDFKFNSNNVTWEYNNIKVELQISNINFVNVEKENRYIYIVCGENFSEDITHYYSFEGNRIFSYDKIKGMVSWDFKGKTVELNCNGVINAKLFIDQEVVIVLENGQNSNDRVIGYNLDGGLKFENYAPENYKFLYLSASQDRITVVCEGGNSDSYGRNSWHFELNLSTGELTKINLAY